MKRQTVRGLVGHYVRDPDVNAWLEAAALLEQRGHEAGAATWRFRAAHFPALLAAVTELRQAPRDAIRELVIGPFHVRLRRTAYSLAVNYQREGQKRTLEWWGFGGEDQTQALRNRLCLEFLDRLYRKHTGAAYRRTGAGIAPEPKGEDPS